MNFKLAVLFGNRDFFPGEVVEKARKEMSEAIKRAGLEPVFMDASLTKDGAVNNLKDGYLFRDFIKEQKPDGIVVCLPNFGDESSICVALENTKIPILVQAYPDNEFELGPSKRRDAFCGKMSVMDVLHQYGIKFSLTRKHVIHPLEAEFIQELKDFAGVCRIVKGMKNCRLGAIGARTSAFKTVRYDEITLQRNGITVETIDMSEVFGRMDKIDVKSSKVLAKVKEFEEYTDRNNAPQEALLNEARLSLVIDQLISELDLDVLAIRCWDELEKQYKCAPCTVMSMLGEKRNICAACEMDVNNAIMMKCLSLASNSHSTLLDWNNNYKKEEDKCILFHCGPVPTSMMMDKGYMVEHVMFQKTYGEGSGWGPIEGILKSGDVTIASAKTEDGKFSIYTLDAKITKNQVDRIFFGVYGVVEIENLQTKLRFLGENGFRHHVALTGSHVAKIMKEAFENYLGYDVISLP